MPATLGSPTLRLPSAGTRPFTGAARSGASLPLRHFRRSSLWPEDPVALRRRVPGEHML